MGTAHATCIVHYELMGVVILIIFMTFQSF